MRISGKMFMVAAVIAMLSGCTEQQDEWQPYDGMTITATCPGTRTVNKGLSTEWEQSDKLSVFSYSINKYNNNKFVYSGSSQFHSTAHFKYTGTLYAAYPYDSHNTTPKAVSINVNQAPVQNGNNSTNHLAGSGFPLYGKFNGSGMPSFPMNQMLTVGRFVITNGGESAVVVKSIEFTAPVAIAGHFTVDITGGTPSYAPVSGQSSNTVILTVTNGTEIAAGGSAEFNVGMVPFDETGDYSITVTADCGGEDLVSHKDITGRTLSLPAGNIIELNYTIVATQPPYVDLGAINLVNEDMNRFLHDADSLYTNDNWHDLAYPNKSVGFTLLTEENSDVYHFGSGGDNSEGDAIMPNAIGNDRPNPVTIPVNGLDGETVTVTICGEGAFSSETYTVTSTVSDSKVEVYNLIPNRGYQFSVTYDGNEVSTGRFDTEGRRRIMKVSDVISADYGNNMRDLGGLQTTDGKTLKFGKVFRGTNIDGLPEEGKNYMTDVLNIGLVVDLRLAKDKNGRTRQEAKQILEKADWSHIGFAVAPDLVRPDSARLGPTMIDIINALQADKPVYIHCFAGADRTGCICMLIEALCGVSEKDCTIDYELTAFSCIGKRDRTAYNVGYMGYFHVAICNSEGNTFKEKAENFLMTHGVTREQITALQNALIEQ